MVQVQVYESTLNTSGEGMFLPIHKACLGIIQKLCQMRQAQSQASGPEIPKTLEAFVMPYSSKGGEVSLSQISQSGRIPIIPNISG